MARTSCNCGGPIVAGEGFEVCAACGDTRLKGVQHLLLKIELTEEERQRWETRSGWMIPGTAMLEAVADVVVIDGKVKHARGINLEEAQAAYDATAQLPPDVTELIAGLREQLRARLKYCHKHGLLDNGELVWCTQPAKWMNRFGPEPNFWCDEHRPLHDVDPFVEDDESWQLLGEPPAEARNVGPVCLKHSHLETCCRISWWEPDRDPYADAMGFECMAVVENPEAIGEPNATPVVRFVTVAKGGTE